MIVAWYLWTASVYAYFLNNAEVTEPVTGLYGENNELREENGVCTWPPDKKGNIYEMRGMTMMIVTSWQIHTSRAIIERRECMIAVVVRQLHKKRDDDDD